MRGSRSILLSALSGLALARFDAPARAAAVAPSGDIVTITFTGTVDSSADPFGTFGCGATATCDTDNPYAGDAYTATFTFNTGVGFTDNQPDTVVYAEGGTLVVGNPEPPASPLVGDATVTVDGVTYELPGAYYAILQSNSSGEITGALPYQIFAEVSDASGNELFGEATTSSTPPPQFPVSITTPFSVNFGGNASSFILFDCSLGSCAGNIQGDMSVSLVNDSTIPEPSTWVMMGVGFGGLAFAGYRRARTAAAT